MRPTGSGEAFGTVHLVERRMLFHDAVARAAGKSRAEEPACRYRFMTVSRDPGTMGDGIAQELAGHLGWRVYDKEIVNCIARNSHVRESMVQELDERAQNLIHDTVQRFLRMAEGGSFGIEEYHEALLKTLAFLATRGEAILVGRGANFALQAERTGLHVRIVGSLEVRVERLSQRWGVPRAEAHKRVLELDAERRNYIRHHFKQDLNDHRFYDLVFNTDHMDPHQVVASVLGVLCVPKVAPPAISEPEC